MENDYKKFAQNIYQAKLLAVDINQKELELFCDLMIGYAYSKIGVVEKSLCIYDDVIKASEKSAMFNIICIAKYLKAKLKLSQSLPEETLKLVSESLSMIRDYDNLSKILFAMFEQFYVELVEKYKIVSTDIEEDKQQLAHYASVIKFLAPDDRNN